MGIARILATLILVLPLANQTVHSEPSVAIDGAQVDLSVKFASLTPTDRPNRFLMCPRELCRAEPDRVSPEYDVTVSRLLDWWLIMIEAQPRVERLATETESMQYHFVQRSELFGFPDLITVRFIAPGDDRSTLAVYSRSIQGYYDFGTNRARVESWLEEFPHWVTPLASDR